MKKIICIILIQLYIFCTINIREVFALSPSTSVQKVVNQYNDSGVNFSNTIPKKIKSNEKTPVISEKLSKNINENQKKTIAKSIMMLGIVIAVIALIITITLILLGPVFGIISIPWWGFLICGLVIVIIIIVSVIAGVEYGNEQKRVEEEIKAKELADKQEEERKAKELADKQEKERKAKELADKQEEERKAKELADKQEEERKAKELADKKEKELKEVHFKYLKDFFEENEKIATGKCELKKLKQDFKDYVENYKNTWTIETYVNILQKTKHLQDLLKVKDDSILKIVTNIFPRIIEQVKDKEKRSLTKAYDQFIEEWFEREIDNWAEKGSLKGLQKKYFYNYADILVDNLNKKNKEDFNYSDWNTFLPTSTKYPEHRKKQAFSALPLIKVSDNQYTFWHSTFIDYFTNKSFADKNIIIKKYDKQEKLERKKTRKIKVFKEEQIELLNHRIANSSKIGFMADSINEDSDYRKTLFKIFEKSKTDKNIRNAGVNAIRSLNLAGVLFMQEEFELYFPKENKEETFTLDIDFTKGNYKFLEFIKIKNSDKYSLNKFREFIKIFEIETQKQNRVVHEYAVNITMENESKKVAKKEVCEVFYEVIRQAS